MSLLAGDRGIATTSRLKVKEEDESSCVVPPFKRHKHETTFQDPDLMKSPDSVLPKKKECLADALAAANEHTDLMLAKARELGRLAEEDPDYFKRQAETDIYFRIYAHLWGKNIDVDEDEDEDEDEE